MWHRISILWLHFLRECMHSDFHPICLSGVSNHTAIFVRFISDLNKWLCSVQWRLIDWLPGSCCFGPIDRSISAICSIILSSGTRPKPCQQMQHSTPLTVIRLPLRESLDRIRKGTWPPNYKLSSAPRWHLSTVIVLCLGDGATITRTFPLQGSGKTGPPATQLMRPKQPGSHSAVKREKRLSTSSFPLSANRELQKLLALAGTPPSQGDPSLSLMQLISLITLSPPLQDNLYLGLNVWSVWMKGIVLTIHRPCGSS